ncbi:cytochrome o ubiquinol oxidase subunit IV [Escherichia coli]|uniref:Cytochrome o ubiquinol oxidase subunit IV n=1 Tax=Escherichia coli TaxID=562 RepID=A0AAX2KFB2_ECOLX|nr:cytochrome o ubiquinol oxidase subunit IV [Escherichia coli]
MSHSTDHSGASHGSVKTYMTGFILSIILTVIPFWMVMTGAASPAVILEQSWQWQWYRFWCIWCASCT